MNKFDEIKSKKFRIRKIGDIFYIQRKTIFGWNYRAEIDPMNGAGGWAGLLIFLRCCSWIGLMVGLISLGDKGINETNKTALIVFSIGSILFTTLVYGSKYFSSRWSEYDSFKSLSDAENKIDELVKYKIKKLEIKEDKRVKKIYNFENQSQIRKEKLEKLEINEEI